MKKIIVFIYLLFQITTTDAQYPGALPLSGVISLQQIYNWMLGAGEISAGPYSISSLNSGSHFADKSTPYSMSDWYGYALACVSSSGSIGVSPSGYVLNGTPINLWVNSGVLATGATWTWKSGSPTGTVVGTGISVYVNPPYNASTVYFLMAVGGCVPLQVISTTGIMTHN